MLSILVTVQAGHIWGLGQTHNAENHTPALFRKSQVPWAGQGRLQRISEELRLPTAAAAHHAVIPKHPGRADLSIVTHQAETALPVSGSALPSQGHPQGHTPGKHAQILLRLPRRF